jgi:hypothetical protein
MTARERAVYNQLAEHNQHSSDLIEHLSLPQIPSAWSERLKKVATDRLANALVSIQAALVPVPLLLSQGV